MADTVVVNSGSLDITFCFPLYRGGATIAVKGLVMDGDAIDASPLLDHSSRVPTVNGGSVVNVNSNGAGTGSINVLYDDTFNNAWKIASEIAYSKEGANMQGGTITVTQQYNGENRTVQFIDCVWQNVPIFMANPMSPSIATLTFSFAEHTTIGAEVTA